MSISRSGFGWKDFTPNATRDGIEGSLRLGLIHNRRPFTMAYIVEYTIQRTEEYTVEYTVEHTIDCTVEHAL